MGNNEEMEVDALNSSVRVRQYPEGHNGPYVVIIRRKDVPLESKKINKYVFSRFKHVLKVSQENEHKIKIIFGEKKCQNEKIAQVQQNAEALGDDNENDICEIVMTEIEKKKLIEKKIVTQSARDEANSLPKYAEWNKKYYVYIPEKLVETKGVISWPVGNDVKDIIDECSTGKFSSPILGEVKVLEAVRLKRKTENASSDVMEDTGTVIVTFEGLLLPKWVNFDQMLIPVREFRAKQMFCKNCHRYNHTEKRCNNKKITPPTQIRCIQCNSNEHDGGSKECPKRKFLEKRVQQTTRQMRKKTYAEMLKELDPNGVMPNERANEDSYPPMVFPSRKSLAAKRKQQADPHSSESPQRKKKSPNNSQQSSPPGFSRQTEVEEQNEFAEMIMSYIKSMVDDMNLPPFFMQFIDRNIIPFIHKQIVKITNSMLEKFNFSSWLN